MSTTPTLLPLCLCVVVSAAACRSEVRSEPAAALAAATTAKSDPDRREYIGTWKSVWFEEHKLTGELIEAPAAPENDNSFVIFDGAGHWSNTNLPISHLKSKSFEQLTPEEAREILFERQAPNRTASSYFGTYNAFGPNVPDRLVIDYLAGGVDPSRVGTVHHRMFDFVGDQFNFKLLPLTKPHQITWRIWKRVPPLAQLTPTHRKLIGFWKLVSSERRKASGELVSSTPIDVGYLIYTSSGYVQFHLQQPNRQKWASSSPCAECRGGQGGPTLAEAKATFATYAAYTGQYAVDEAKNAVVHLELGPVSGQQGKDAQHTYEFSGDRIILRSPLVVVDGQQVRNVITAERVSGTNPADQP